MSADEIDLRPATTEELLRFLESVPARHASGGDGRIPDDEGQDGRNCPPASAYMEVVLGSCELAKGQALLNHAATCSICAGTLTASLRTLEGDPSAEEMQAMAGLETTQPEYQRRISLELAGSRAGRRPVLGPGGLKLLWGMGIAAAVIVAAGAGIFAWQRHVGSPERLLGRAYTDSRTLELRIPEAGYAALKPGAHTRGDAEERESPALLEARAKLEQTLEKSPEDDRSLALAARADLLEEHYDAAIDKLDRLIVKGPATKELLTDGATAYFERGLVTGRELDRTVALDYLHRAELMAPNDPVVLFNEAIVMEDRAQLMNAADVWRRFTAVERDPEWAAEGRRRLAALETTLDRLKSHESRVLRMLATPEAMLALAADAGRLAQWDEELSSVKLDELTERAFPGSGDDKGGNVDAENVRGSPPCTAVCAAARALLYAVGQSLKQQHHDTWLADILLSPSSSPSASLPSTLAASGFEGLPLDIQAKYGRAMRLLGKSALQNQTGRSGKGLMPAQEARQLFEDMARNRGDALLSRAGKAGEWRATAEYLFALQRNTDFTGCRAFAAAQLGRAGEDGWERVPREYSWIQAVSLLTEKICDDTPQTVEAGKALGKTALRLATGAHYRLLTARIQLHIDVASELAGNQELREEEILGSLRDLMRGDPPPVRIANPLGSLAYIEYPSPRNYAAALLEEETIDWCELSGDEWDAIAIRMQLGMLLIRLGSFAEGQSELQKGRDEAAKLLPGDAITPLQEIELLIKFVEVLLERGDIAGAQRQVEKMHARTVPRSDHWLLKKKAAVQGQLELEQHHYDAAERLLKSEIEQRQSAIAGESETEAAAQGEQEIAAQDHDLYGELAAVWLAQGRPTVDALALWEEFRLRSQGLSVPGCARLTLECEREALEAERRRMGRNLLTGEIVLMDRVLVYEMDERGVRWSTHEARRQDTLDAVHRLDWAISSPLTSPATAQMMGKSLSELLLPAWKTGALAAEATLLLEPDAELRGLAWPVMPTEQGALGLHVAVAEVASILAGPTETKKNSPNGARETARPLVIGASIAGKGETPLPEAIEEAERVGGYLEAPDLLLGSKATTQNVAAELSQASLLHFAGHAIQDDGGTRLLLADETRSDGKSDTQAETRSDTRQDTRPWIDEGFLRLHPPRACRLAVLSACATGADQRDGTAPMRDLVQTLSSLGVPEVVATRWPVDSEASVSFMNAFYKSLGMGEDVAHSLLFARQLQAHTTTYRNPYFWGAYYVTGRSSVSAKRELHASTGNKNSCDRTQERSLQERPF